MWKWPTVKLISRFPFSSLSLQSALQESSFPFSFAHRTSWWWWLWWRWTREREKESKKQGRMKNTKVAIEVLYVGNERREEQWLRSRSGWRKKQENLLHLILHNRKRMMLELDASSFLLPLSSNWLTLLFFSLLVWNDYWIRGLFSFWSSFTSGPRFKTTNYFKSIFFRQKWWCVNQFPLFSFSSSLYASLSWRRRLLFLFFPLKFGRWTFCGLYSNDWVLFYRTMILMRVVLSFLLLSLVLLSLVLKIERKRRR